VLCFVVLQIMRDRLSTFSFLALSLLLNDLGGIDFVCFSTNWENFTLVLCFIFCFII